MTIGRALLGLGLLGACDGGPDVSPHPCASPELGLEVAPPGGDYGDLTDGGELWTGIPPQGGAPYSPFRVRLEGPADLFDGIDVRMAVTEGDEVVADDTIPMRLVCANVGESAGRWVGSEVHLIYTGHSLEDLSGRDVNVTVTVNGGADGELEVSAHGRATLVVD